MKSKPIAVGEYPQYANRGKQDELLCLISLALALRLLKDNISTSMIYIIKILQMTEIPIFSASILDKAHPKQTINIFR